MDCPLEEQVPVAKGKTPYWVADEGPRGWREEDEAPTARKEKDKSNASALVLNSNLGRSCNVRAYRSCVACDMRARNDSAAGREMAPKWLRSSPRGRRLAASLPARRFKFECTAPSTSTQRRPVALFLIGIMAGPGICARCFLYTALTSPFGHDLHLPGASPYAGC